MEQPTFFTEFLLVIVVATWVAVIFDRLRLPAVLGFLLAGLVIGPQGFSLLSSTENIHHLAEMGVVLLMFTIGLEFSVDHLRGVKNIAIWGGSLQILISIGLSLLFTLWSSLTLYQGFVLGSVIALSSTALVLKYLIDRGEVGTEHGRIAISILIFQDLAILPLMIFTSGLSLSTDQLAQNLFFAFLKTSGLILFVIVFSRYVLPHLLRQIAMSRSREIFFLTSIVICLGMAWVSGQLGLSFAVGAFIAGFMFANTDYKSQIMGDVIPFRHVFVSIFFVSIGLLFDIHFAIEHILTVVTVFSFVLFINFVLMSLLIVAFGYPPRVALAAGIMLSQIGEFSFLIIESARNAQGIDEYLYQLLLSVAFMTLLITPFLFSLVPVVLRISENIPFFGLPPRNWKKSKLEKNIALKNHYIICGFGKAGEDLAMTLKEEKVPFLIIEMNPQKVKKAKKLRMKAIYGDAANEEVIKRAGIKKAKALIVSYVDPFGVGQMIRISQGLNEDAEIVVRTRYERDVAKLYDLGADTVIIEEWQSSYELNRIILSQLEISEKKINHHLDRIQSRKELLVEEAILKKDTEGF